MAEIYTQVKHTDYLKLINRCEALENENAKLKAELKRATAKKAEEKTETKKGGNK